MKARLGWLRNEVARRPAMIDWVQCSSGAERGGTTSST